MKVKGDHMNKKRKSFQHKCIPVKVPVKGSNRYWYRLEWFTKGSYLIPNHRNTDEIHARAFCKRWGLTFNKSETAFTPRRGSHKQKKDGYGIVY